MTSTVWRDLTQTQLDWAYDQTQHAPNMAEVLARCAAHSDEARATLLKQGTLMQRMAYGPSAVEALDWYPSRAPHAPLVFFVHGGAWRRGLAKDYGMAAAWLHERGAHLVVPDFSAVTDVDGDMLTMAEQLQRALAFTVRHAAEIGADAQRIYVVGHSSGAHLAAGLASHNWAPKGFTKSPVHGLLCCSGMYELEPVSLSARSNYVRFSPKTLQDLSPQRHLHHITMPVTLMCGENESPEFKRQARDFAQGLSDRGADLTFRWGADLNHFEMLETFAHPKGLMSQYVQALMQG